MDPPLPSLPRSRAGSLDASMHCTLDALSDDTALCIIRDHFLAVVGTTLAASCPTDVSAFRARLADGVFLERAAAITYTRVTGASAPEALAAPGAPAAARFDRCVGRGAGEQGGRAHASGRLAAGASAHARPAHAALTLTPPAHPARRSYARMMRGMCGAQAVVLTEAELPHRGRLLVALKFLYQTHENAVREEASAKAAQAAAEAVASRSEWERGGGAGGGGGAEGGPRGLAAVVRGGVGGGGGQAPRPSRQLAKLAPETARRAPLRSRSSAPPHAPSPPSALRAQALRERRRGRRLRGQAPAHARPLLRRGGDHHGGGGARGGGGGSCASCSPRARGRSRARGAPELRGAPRLPARSLGAELRGPPRLPARALRAAGLCASRRRARRGGARARGRRG